MRLTATTGVMVGGRTCTSHFPQSGKSGQRDTISYRVMYNFMTKEKKLYKWKVKGVFHTDAHKNTQACTYILVGTVA